MNEKLTLFFAKHKILFILLNLAYIIILAKSFQLLAYPNADFTSALTVDRIYFMLFGLENQIGGIVLTFYLAFAAIILSFIGGSLLGIARWSGIKIFSIPAIMFIELFRALPHIMVIFWVFFALPIFFGVLFDIQVTSSALTSAIIAFTLFESAHIAEIVRAGLNSIPKGQFEAAKTLGMNSWQIFIDIILPQAYRRMIPSILSQFVSLFKDTSLVYVIGVVEFFRAATIINNRIYMSFEILSFVALVYFLCAFTLSKIAGRLEKTVEKQLNS
tara:strand:- start:179 stop:997 length:819 start_codon:yes stop_codon:yes gene_type:complete